jgi:folate-binding protein YgfZ
MPSIAEEYRIVTERAGWVDRGARGRIRLRGRDAAPFLHGLLTNAIIDLAPGQGTYAAYLTPHGRMITDVTVYRLADELLLSVEPGIAPALAEKLDQLIFAEDVQVEDISPDLAEIAVLGAEAPAVAARALGLDPERLAALPPNAHSSDADRIVARIDLPAVAAFAVFVPAAGRDRTVQAIEQAGAAPISAAVVDLLRVESGRPQFGIDMTGETIPLEAGLLERAISTSKGCYVGQEVIIRVLHRGGGRVAKRLVRLAFEPADARVTAGAALMLGDREIGRVTSVAASPAHGAIGLGYVHRDTADTESLTIAGSPLIARITGSAS